MQFEKESGVNTEEGLDGEKDGGGEVRITNTKDICKGHMETYYLIRFPPSVCVCVYKREKDTIL